MTEKRIRNLIDHYRAIQRRRWEKGAIIEPKEHKSPPTDIPLAIYEQREVERLDKIQYTKGK